MGDFSIVNPREVEASAAQFGMPADMEARFPKRALGSTIGVVSLPAAGAPASLALRPPVGD